MSIEIDHWMTFGTFNEQKYYVYPDKDTYKGIIINANMAAYAPSGLASFLMSKVRSVYLIDPQTHAFQHEPTNVLSKKNEVKKSIRNLADEYSNIIKNNVGDRPLLPHDFSNDKVINELVSHCIKFQKNFLSSEMIKTDENKYLNYEQNDLHPYAIIAPYFYMSDVTMDSWLGICVQSAKITKEIVNDKKVFAAIVINQGILLDKLLIDRLVDSYTGIELDGFIIWIDNFDEATVGIKELEGLLTLVRLLKEQKNDIEIINRHGGYFSILAAGILGDNAFTGVAHGPEFGEYRAVIPVGGGLPIAKYYIPQLHQRIKYRDAVTYFNKLEYLKDHDTFHQNVCNCSLCKKVIDNNIKNFTKFGDSNTRQINRGSGIVSMQYPKTETREICLMHYLQRKNFEFQFSATASKDQILDDLNHGLSKYESIAGLDNTSHLTKWIKIFS